MKRLIILFLIALFFHFINTSTLTVFAKSNDEKITIIYFYSPTCGSCQELKDYFIELKNKYKNLNLIEYSISNLKNKNLLDKYCKAYNVSSEDAGMIPAVFVRDKYFNDNKDIKQYIEKEILNINAPKTLEIKEEAQNNEIDIGRFLNYKSFAIFAAGIVNGFNPCSMSMLLMFMSLLLFDKINVLKIGISYCLGKFISFMLLGTVFYSFLDKFYVNGFNTIIKILIISVILMIISLNINDYFAAKNEQYNKIRLQLPFVFRKLNHNFIKKTSVLRYMNLFVIISFVLGIFISLGEFLCTGQIYLATIVTVFQTGINFGFKIMHYLLIYNLGFILPSLILTFGVYKGKEIFEVSEFIRQRLHIIKLINSATLLIFCLIIIIYF